MSTSVEAGVASKRGKQEKTQSRSRMYQLVTDIDPRSTVSEAYRILQTNFNFKNIDGNLKYLAITSSVPGEGKTTTSANFAMTLAQTGKKVILVDADLRRPSVHKVFGVSSFEGLTNALVEGLDPLSLLKEVKGLSLLTSGALPPNPSELLGSTRMKTILERLGEAADYVVFDCPPVLGLNDTLALAPSVDGFLLVVGSGKVPKTTLKESRDQLGKVGAKMIGAVVNAMDARDRKGSYYYYYNSQY